jgi:DNA polymerase-3 subunit epsilon
MELNLEAPKTWTWAPIDTETSGLFDFSKPAHADGQPRLACLALIRCTPTWAITQREIMYVYPEGWEMTPEVVAINGLTTEFLKKHGRPISEVLDAYEAAIDEGRAIAAFNAQFDTKVLRGELRRAGRPDRFEATPNICLMRKTIGVCKLPKAKGNGYKFPKLAEAMRHFKLPFPNQHTAGGDADAVVLLGRALTEIGIHLEPEVHFAKTRPKDETENGVPAEADAAPAPVHQGRVSSRSRPKT